MGDESQVFASSDWCRYRPRGSVSPENDSNLIALRGIITEHFRCSCSELLLLDEGAHSTAYQATLETSKKLFIRIILPIYGGLKTEAEVAVMDLVGGSCCPHPPYCHELT